MNLPRGRVKVFIWDRSYRKKYDIYMQKIQNAETLIKQCFGFLYLIARVEVRGI